MRPYVLQHERRTMFDSSDLSQSIRRKYHKPQSKSVCYLLAHRRTSIQRADERVRSHRPGACDEVEDIAAARFGRTADPYRELRRHGFTPAHCVIGIIGRHT
jgi:hypothetical protein